MDFNKTVFKRRFSVNFFKNLRLDIARMSFTGKPDATRGDQYPCLGKVARGGWDFERRLLCSLTPYMNVELASKAGPCGVSVSIAQHTLDLFIHRRNGETELAVGEESVVIKEDNNRIVSVQICPGFLDVYSRAVNANSFCSEMRLLHSFKLPELEQIMVEKALNTATVAILTPDIDKMYYVSAFMDCGVAQADPRAVKYENGEIIENNGKLYFTFSARAEHGTYQCVMSWVAGTMRFELEGVILYCTADGVLGADDVAASLMYDRTSGVWRINYASFSHGHVLGSAVFEGDVRFGVNIIDTVLMPKAPAGLKVGEYDHMLYGKDGDEDPDLFYDEKRGVWLKTLCRLVEEDGKNRYRYMLFESDKVDGEYRFVSSTVSGEQTGGNIVRIDGEMLFICGNAFDKRADYLVYRLPDLTHAQNLRFDYDDGGFRGWGTVIPVKRGTRTRHFHLTFDRVRNSSFNWSYGNIYVFEAVEE